MMKNGEGKRRKCGNGQSENWSKPGFFLFFAPPEGYNIILNGSPRSLVQFYAGNWSVIEESVKRELLPTKEKGQRRTT